MAAAEQPKVDFANGLRGIAALVVALSHLAGFWFNPDAITHYLHVPPMPAAAGAPWLADKYTDIVPAAQSSQFAIALFFLISGFVIPFAFTRQTRAGFLAARFFRIWPLYAVGFAISVLAVYGVSSYFGRPYLPDTSALLAHLTFTQDIAGAPLLDGIVWTLNIEVRFYVVCALMAPWLRRGLAWPVVAVSVVGAVPSFFALQFLEHSPVAMGLSVSWMFMSLMFVGTMLNFLHRRTIPVWVAALCIVLLLAAFVGQCISALPTTTAGQFIYPGPRYLPTYVAAAAAFIAFFALRRFFPRIGVLDHLADISFPLYVVHAMLGQALMRVMVEQGWPLDGIFIMTLGIVWAVSTILHVLVERPTHEFGRRLSYRRPQAAAGAG